LPVRFVKRHGGSAFGFAPDGGIATASRRRLLLIVLQVRRNNTFTTRRVSFGNGVLSRTYERGAGNELESDAPLIGGCIAVHASTPGTETIRNIALASWTDIRTEETLTREAGEIIIEMLKGRTLILALDRVLSSGVLGNRLHSNR
jgi:hypothetical protein